MKVDLSGVDKDIISYFLKKLLPRFNYSGKISIEDLNGFLRDYEIPLYIGKDLDGFCIYNSYP